MKVVSTKMSLAPDNTRRRPGVPFEFKLAKGKRLPNHLTEVGKEPEPEPVIETLSEMGKVQAVGPVEAKKPAAKKPAKTDLK